MPEVEHATAAMLPLETALRSQEATNPAFSTLHSQAWTRFEAIGWPHRRSEAWRNIDLAGILATPYAMPAAPKQLVSLKNERLAVLNGPRLVFLNGLHAPKLSRSAESMAELEFKAFSDVEDANWLTAQLMQGLDAEKEPFAVLNAACLTNGALVHLQPNQQVEQTLQIDWLSIPNDDEPVAMAHPRVLIVAEAGSHVRVVLQFAGPRQTRYANNAVVQVIAHEQAHVEMTIVQNESCSSRHLSSTRVTQAESSHVSVTTVAVGHGLARHEVSSTFTGLFAEGATAHCQLNGLSAIDGIARAHHHLTVEHPLPHCTSEQLYKAILSDTTLAEFNGTIHVHPSAIGTDAAQLNQNLVLSDQARALTLPQLRILADDVKCSHGATVGQLRDEELFYLRSRGLSDERARCLLTFGFAEEVLARITNVVLRNHLERIVLDRLGQSQSPLGCNQHCLTPC